MTVVRSMIRSLKNEINNYDDGERLVRELTSNEATPPSTQMLLKLRTMMTNQYQFPSIFNMLFRRLKDYDKIRHVEKSLIVIEYLLKNAERKFVRYCQMEIKTISRLQRYRYILNYKDYGELIRKRAKRIYGLLKDEKKLQAARAKAQGYAMGYKNGTQYENQKKRSKQKKVRPQKQPKGQGQGQGRRRSPDEEALMKKRKKKSKSSPQQNKKKKKKKTKNNNNKRDPKFEAFIDVPEPANNTSSGFAAPPDDDLLSDLWTGDPQSTANNTNSTDFDNQDGDDFGWYTAGGDGPETGFGDDGGQFNFGDDDEFFDANGDEAQAEEEEEEEDLDALYSELTEIDNILDVKKKANEVRARNTTGKTMAEMANATATDIPSSFDVAFINEALNNPNANETNDFDPFGLGPTTATTGNATAGTSMFAPAASNQATNMFGQPQPAKKSFGYQPKQQQNLYPYGNDPFAELSNRKKTKYHTMGMGSAANISRVAPSQNRDPFAQFNIK